MKLKNFSKFLLILVCCSFPTEYILKPASAKMTSTAGSSSGFGNSSLFNNILLQVTGEKLNELKTQQNLMKTHFQPVLTSVNVNAAASAAPSPKAALALLHQAIKDSPIKNVIRDEATLVETVRYFIAGLDKDPLISNQIVGVWVEKLKEEIEFGLRRCEYSFLYGSLLSEWLEHEQTAAAGKMVQIPAIKSDTSCGTGQTKDNALDELRALMFTLPPTPFDKEGFMNRLKEEVFNVQDNAEHRKLLESVRQDLSHHFDVTNHIVDVSALRSCIDGLCSEDYVALDKKTALLQLKENSEALAEVASLLTNRIRHLHLWDWSASNVHVNLELSRGLAGEWRTVLSEDVITMLLLRYIGVEWGSKFKKEFLRMHDGMWDKTEIFSPVPHLTISHLRKYNYRTSLLSELPDSMYSQQAKNPDEYVQLNSASKLAKPEATAKPAEIVQPPTESATQQTQQTQDQGIAVPELRSMQKSRKYPAITIDPRQSFLHLLATEIKLHHTIYPMFPFIVVQSNYKQFAASLLHEPVLAILEFFNMPGVWLDFFTKAIRTPFEGRARERGIPDSHILGSFFGDITLFVLDFHINRNAGINLHRVLGQFWLWDNDIEKMTKAWKIVEEFGTILGLKVDTKKSGSTMTYAEAKLSEFCESKGIGTSPEVRARVRIAAPTPLPAGSVRWAYLELASNGRFAIDQQALKLFTDEMKGHLAKASGSTLQYINVYNKYMEFFIRNFGRNALVFGDQHVEQIVDSLQQIHGQLFPEQGGNIVKVLKRKAKLEQLLAGGTDIVDVWVYWPLERGGLGLVNPFLEIMALHASYNKNYPEPEDRIRELEFTPLLLQDKTNYDEHVKILEERNKQIECSRDPMPARFRVPNKIPTFEEYIENREANQVFHHWYKRYLRLLERPTGLEPPTITAGGPKADAYRSIALPGPGDVAGNNHFQWVYAYYEPQLLRHFGTIQFINTELLPMSMIGNIRKSKVKHY